MSVDIRITPLNELMASDFANESYPHPDVSGKEGPDQWEAYWLKSLKDAGLTTLRQYMQGIAEVAIETIGIEEARIIVDRHFSCMESEEMDEVVALSGGLHIRVDNQEAVCPQSMK